MKILIADDEPMSRRLLTRTLERAGYEVLAVENGRLAVEQLCKPDGPRLALLDWIMPELDGPGVCREVRKHPNLPYIHIVMLTSKGSKEDMVAGLESGAADYVIKPWDPEELKARLRVGRRISELEDRLVEARETMRFEATQLAESEAKLHAVLQAATQIAVIATDLAGLITVFNPGAERMLGYSAEEVVGRSTPEIFHLRSEVQERGEELTQKLGRPIEGFRVFVEQAYQDVYEEREWTYVRKDGTRLTVILTVTELRDVRGNASGFLGIAKDITKRKEAEREILSALQMKSDFVSFAAHQLRTPLSGVKWLLELAAQGEPLPAETASFIQDARQSAQRLIDLVNDLLDVSRIESGKITLAPVETDLAELTREVLKDVSPQIELRGHRVSVSSTEKIPPVQVDPQLFRQAVLNLVNNAIKYTLSGGEIGIQMRTENGFVLWSIQDNGIGIPKASQAHLFEKFYRAENVCGIETEGTGLGLYMARLVVERSGGQVRCDSEEGKGSTFILTLPLSRGN